MRQTEAATATLKQRTCSSEPTPLRKCESGVNVMLWEISASSERFGEPLPHTWCIFKDDHLTPSLVGSTDKCPTADHCTEAICFHPTACRSKIGEHHWTSGLNTSELYHLLQEEFETSGLNDTLHWIVSSSHHGWWSMVSKQRSIAGNIIHIAPCKIQSSRKRSPFRYEVVLRRHWTQPFQNHADMSDRLKTMHHCIITPIASLWKVYLLGAGKGVKALTPGPDGAPAHPQVLIPVHLPSGAFCWQNPEEPLPAFSMSRPLTMVLMPSRTNCGDGWGFIASSSEMSCIGLFAPSSCPAAGDWRQHSLLSITYFFHWRWSCALAPWAWCKVR